MVSFGDIEISWLTSKDTGISKDTVEKNFVDEPPQVFELTADLEAGTYSAILNETVHEKNESFEEQQDAVLSMVSRHGTEFPFESSGDNGYILVNSASVNIFPSLEIREGELQVRFLEQSDYNSAIKAYPRSYYGGDFAGSADPVESFVALPSSLNVLNHTEDYQVTAEDGNLSLYTFTDSGSIFEFEEDSNDITLSQTQSVCRLFNSSDERIYGDKRVVDNGSTIGNALVSVDIGSTSSSLEYYDGSWQTIGSTQLPFNDGYAEENTNDEVTTLAINDNSTSIYRGVSAVEYNFSAEASFDFEPTASFTEQTVSDYYAHWEDGNGRDIVIVRASSDGSFYTGADMIGIENLTSSEDYSAFVGVVPADIPVADYARYLYNYGLRNRSFTQV